MPNQPRVAVLIIAISVLAGGLGAAPIQPLPAHRADQNQQEAGDLKIITMPGKGRVSRPTDPRGPAPPPPLTQSQRQILYKGRTPNNSFPLTPNKPLSNTARLIFKNASVYPGPAGYNFAYLAADGENNSQHWVSVEFEAKVGQLYAIDFSVAAYSAGTFTVTNLYNVQIKQTTPATGPKGQHVTIYVKAESTYLEYALSGSVDWKFFACEVTPV